MNQQLKGSFPRLRSYVAPYKRAYIDAANKLELERERVKKARADYGDSPSARTKTAYENAIKRLDQAADQEYAALTKLNAASERWRELRDLRRRQEA